MKQSIEIILLGCGPIQYQ